jgi:hypothetical protein
MKKLTLEKLADIIKDSIDSLSEAVLKGFTKVHDELNLLKQGQEDIVLRLDQKANAFDLRSLDKKVSEIDEKMNQ